MEIDNSKLVSKAEVAGLLGCSVRQISRLTASGVLTQTEKNLYVRDVVLKSYGAYETCKNTRGRGNKKSKDDADYRRERTLLTKTQREKAEMELATIRGELHRAEDVKSVMTDMLGAFRARIMAIPTSLAPQLVAETEIVVVQSTLKKHLWNALQELSEYDPELFHGQE